MSGEPLATLETEALKGFDQASEELGPQDPVPALINADDLTGLNRVRNTYGILGYGQTVAVIDSGIDYLHPALGGGFGTSYRVVGGWDFTGENDADPFDDGPYGGHGTHVAGIIGSSDLVHLGVAPQVDLVSLRVFDDQGAGQFSWVEQALQWVYDHRDDFEFPITTVNLSIGTNWNANNVPNWAMLEDEFARLEQAGVFISVAAGNRFASYNTTGLSYPAASSHVVPVASVDQNGQLSSFSQRNDRVIAAPGRNIYSTVPDYLGDLNGREDDFARLSGTSMAAPYVAGASVLIREALHFTGLTFVNEAMVYDVMRRTADMIYDPLTGQNYARLNLERALNDVMPGDEFGSTAATATPLGVIGDGNTITGAIARVDDQDFFSFTAGATGTMTLTIEARDRLVPSWQIVTGNGTIEGNSLKLSVVAGQTYTVGFGTTVGIGNYRIQTALESAPVDWGVVEFLELSGQTMISGDEWRSVTASRDGILSVQASFQQTGGNIQIELYNGRHEKVGQVVTTDGLTRIDADARAGEVFYLRIRGVNNSVHFRLANLVQAAGETVNVFGTSADDLIEFVAGHSIQLSINGLSYSFDAGVVSKIQFVDRGGTDTAHVTLTDGDDTVRLGNGSAIMVGGGLSLTLDGVERVTVNGGGGTNQAELIGTDANDLLTAGPDAAQLVGGAYELGVLGFSHVLVDGAGGQNQALLYDSAGDDQLSIRPGSAVLTGPGFSISANGFASVRGFSSDGFDQAALYDSAGDDQFTATPREASMSGSGFYSLARGFDLVRAFATTGNDQATLYDSHGDDWFAARTDYGQLWGTGFFIHAKGFDTLRAYASLGNDRAVLYGSVSVEVLMARANVTQMIGSGFSNSAHGFDAVRAFGRGGPDQAIYYRTAASEVLVRGAEFSQFTGAGFVINSSDFRSVQLADGQAFTALATRAAATVTPLSTNSISASLTDPDAAAKETKATWNPRAGASNQAAAVFLALPGTDFASVAPLSPVSDWKAPASTLAQYAPAQSTGGFWAPILSLPHLAIGAKSQSAHLHDSALATYAASVNTRQHSEDELQSSDAEIEVASAAAAIELAGRVASPPVDVVFSSLAD